MMLTYADLKPQYHKVWLKQGRLYGKRGVGTGVELLYTEAQLRAIDAVLSTNRKRSKENGK